MIVIGLDVYKQSVTAVALNEVGRPLGEKTVLVGGDELVGWASLPGAERLWAVEDCRQLTRWLERQLLQLGEQLVRVPPRLTVPERRAGRMCGKSDPIAALAIARAALREPNLSRPQLGEQVFRDLKLLVGHRDDLVDARRRTQQRLRWDVHALDPTFVVPLRMLGRSSHLERVSRWLARREQEMQVCLARELVARCRSLNRTIAELDQELEQRAAEIAPALLELRGCHRGEAARGDRSRRALQERCSTCSPLRRGTRGSQLRPRAAPPARPRRQPPAQRRALPDRDHPSPLPPTRLRLPRTQTQRRQEPPRSDPLPSTPTRARRLQHPPREPRLDIGATLAHAEGLSLARGIDHAEVVPLGIGEDDVIRVRRSPSRRTASAIALTTPYALPVGIRVISRGSGPAS